MLELRFGPDGWQGSHAGGDQLLLQRDARAHPLDRGQGAAQAVPSDEEPAFEGLFGVVWDEGKSDFRRNISLVLQFVAFGLLFWAIGTRRKSKPVKNDNENSLPDTKKWQPRKSASETLKSAFLKRCITLEDLIRSKAGHEQEMNIDNYDSGPAIEDIIRNEFKRLLPTRYSVSAGVIADHDGNTSGDCDLVVYNEFWFPILKAGATDESRRVILPIDGVYAVGEIKQTMDMKVLDDAMEKVVVCHRLNRPPTFAYRVVENREGSSCSHGRTNPLYSFVIATGLRKGIELDDVVDRFFFINKSLKRSEVIRALCILGHGTVTWGVNGEQEARPALFMLDDLYSPIVPIYHKSPKSESALYTLMVDLLLHLYHSVLAPEDIAASYGPYVHDIKIPALPEIRLDPDPEQIALLDKICEFEDEHQYIGSRELKVAIRKKRKRHK